MGRYALLVSVAEQDDPQLSVLPTARRYLQPLVDVLASSTAGAFSDVEVLHNEPRTTLLNAVRAVLHDRAPRDVVVVHLACHAVVSRDGRLYFAARDTQAAQLSETALAADELDAMLAACPAGQKLLVLDCRYSRVAATPDEFGGAVPLEQAVGHGYAVLSAGDIVEYLLQPDGVRQVRPPGPDLTAALALALTGPADLDGDRMIRLGELADYLAHSYGTDAVRLLGAGQQQLVLADVRQHEASRAPAASAPAEPPPAPPSAPRARGRDWFRWLRGRQSVLGPPPTARAEPSADDAEAPPQEVIVAGPPPTRTVNPRLDAPAAVTVGSTFTLVVGISAAPRPGVVAQAPFQVPVDTFDLTITLLLDGFRTADGSAPVRTIQAGPQAPYPTAAVDLVAVDDPALRPARSIVATYSIDGRTLGTASTAVMVVPEGEHPPVLPARKEPDRVTGWALPAEGDPDLVVTIARGNDEAGRRLQWTAKSPHPEVVVPAEPVVTLLPEEAASDWARTLLVKVEEHSDPEDRANILRGAQITVGRQIPKEIWTSLASAATVTPQPAVLVTTNDPFIPWELAKVPEPWNARRADVLGAQCSLGRWIYESENLQPNPVHQLGVSTIAVVKGMYDKSARLPEAEAEADHLAADYHAVVVEAQYSAVMKCIKGDPEADALHFAVHGRFDVSGLQDGIIMNDKRTLDPLAILGAETGRPRLVVVNACQVGQTEQMLGDVAGVVPSFIQIGAQAVIAPLWKVDDVAAREFAERLYAGMAAGRGVAEVLAEERAAAMTPEAAGGPRSTVLAYLFFGHPRLTVTMSKEG